MNAIAAAVPSMSGAPMEAIERRLGRERAKALLDMLSATHPAGSGAWWAQEELFAALAWAVRERVPCPPLEKRNAAQTRHNIRMARARAMATAYCAEHHINPDTTDRATGATNLEEMMPMGFGLLEHFDRLCAKFQPLPAQERA